MPASSAPQATSSTTPAVTVYVLYFLAYVTVLTAFFGVIIAHVKADDPDPVLRSHYKFQIMTFWIGLLYLIVGTVLWFFAVGFLFGAWVAIFSDAFIVLWWFIWSLIRNVKGLVNLNKRLPIPRPESWLFG